MDKIFSYFSYLTQSVPEKSISFEELCSLIQKGHTKNKCTELRNQPAKDNNYYRIKKNMPAITPNCTVKRRKLKDPADFEENFIKFSQFVYFDFDNIRGDIESFKRKFIETYQHQVALVAISSSGQGLGVLVKTNRALSSEDEFKAVRNWIHHHVFKNESNLDEVTSDIGRSWIISYDDNIFINYNAIINIPDDLSIPKSIKNVPSQDYIITSYNIYNNNNTNTKKSNNTQQPIQLKWYKKLQLEYIVNERIKLTKAIEVINPFFDFQEHETIKAFSTKNIEDGNKHKIYTYLMFTLLELNPDAPELVFSYIYYLNSHLYKNKMSKTRLNDLFNWAYDTFRKPDFKYNYKKKMIHFNSSAKIAKGQKIKTANKVNGVNKALKSYQKVQDCKSDMQKQGEKISVRNLACYCKVSKTTAQKYLNSEVPDVHGVIEAERTRLSQIIKLGKREANPDNHLPENPTLPKPESDNLSAKSDEAQ